MNSRLKNNKKRSFGKLKKEIGCLIIAVVSMSHSSRPCPCSQEGWQGSTSVASAHWLAAHATAVVAGRGGMYVCVESDAVLLAWLSRSMIR